MGLNLVLKMSTDLDDLVVPQTKRDEPSNVIDYEMIDADARVSHRGLASKQEKDVFVKRQRLMCPVSCSQSLYEAGVKRKGTDVATWITIMSQRSVPHLQRGKQHLTQDSVFLLRGQGSLVK